MKHLETGHFNKKKKVIAIGDNIAILYWLIGTLSSIILFKVKECELLFEYEPFF